MSDTDKQAEVLRATLMAQKAEIEAKSNELKRINPQYLAVFSAQEASSRIEFLLNWLMPFNPDDPSPEADPINIERMEFEQSWNTYKAANLDRVIEEATKSKLVIPVPNMPPQGIV